MLLLNVGETLEEYTRSRSEGGAHRGAARPAGDGAAARRRRGAPGTRLRACPRRPHRGAHRHARVRGRRGGARHRDGEPGGAHRRAFVRGARRRGQRVRRHRRGGRRDRRAGDGGRGETKLRSIVSLVEQSEAFKSETQSRMERLADRIVPWNFLLAGVVALATRSLAKTSAALMVDYSCALKLTGSIAVLSAMRQSAQAGFTVKGSKHFEAMARADTIVFDKTGTLTEATPKVACVLALDGWNRREVLRLAACLEEHFPHPVARAVVRAAAEKNLKHRERHADVEYIVGPRHRLVARRQAGGHRIGALRRGGRGGFPSRPSRPSASPANPRASRLCTWRWTASSSASSASRIRSRRAWRGR